MPRSESEPDHRKTQIDWRGWLVLGWAVAFGVRYLLMVIECRLKR
jgi:hypothetical protein